MFWCNIFYSFYLIYPGIVYKNINGTKFIYCFLNNGKLVFLLRDISLYSYCFYVLILKFFRSFFGYVHVHIANNNIKPIISQTVCYAFSDTLSASSNNSNLSHSIPFL